MTYRAPITKRMYSSTLRWYVGYKVTGGLEAFQALSDPTHATHGNEYAAVIGPFKTKRGAMFMQDHGFGNPHIQHVHDAERIAKTYA